MSVLDILRSDGSIVVNKFLAKTIGLHEAIVLSELISWHLFYADRGELDKEGMFFCTVEKMEENTTLSKHLQSNAINHLKGYGLIEAKQKGIPAKRYFRIVESAIEELVTNKKLKILTSDNSKGSKTKNDEKDHTYKKSKFLTSSGENRGDLEVKNLDGSNTYSSNTYLVKERRNEGRKEAADPIFLILKEKAEKLYVNENETAANHLKEIYIKLKMQYDELEISPELVAAACDEWMDQEVNHWEKTGFKERYEIKVPANYFISCYEKALHTMKFGQLEAFEEV
jgi:hypothetical protein